MNGFVSETVSIELDVQSVFNLNKLDCPNVITVNGDGVNDDIDMNNFVGQCEDFELTVLIFGVIRWSLSKDREVILLMES